MTLDGPFEPVTRRFDLSLRSGSDDLVMENPRLKKNVTSSFPDQISLALSADPSSMWVSWITGDAQIGKNVTPLDPSSVASEVWYGTESGKYASQQDSKSTVYSQLYPFEGLLNYTSGIIHHVRLEGLEPDNVIENDPALVLMVGDLTYANQYLTTGGQGASCFSCSFPNASIRETYQPHWDGWGRFMEPLTSRVPMMVIEGNHEIEPQVDGITFQSYLTRFAVPSEESRSNSSFYYSFYAGGAHFIMLGAYVDYNITGTQYSWLMDDLHRVNRSLTPWVVAAWHPPWYNSYNSHYQEFECMRQEMEALLYQYKVDIVFNDHVHAYERMNRVYNYTLDPCGPVYMTVGDAGNIEKVNVDFADDPGKCPKPDDNKLEFGGLCHLNFTSGPAKGKFCWSKQPEWSAYRESSFGHGILEVRLSNVKPCAF
ncbi:hypothetical protein BT93_H1425 [Corymbia citriodora subsp. variegata]|nr:hypothetical protein BT93_H1425 [Corymbia citriodora subsp. variegata]